MQLRNHFIWLIYIMYLPTSMPIGAVVLCLLVVEWWDEQMHVYTFTCAAYLSLCCSGLCTVYLGSMCSLLSECMIIQSMIMNITEWLSSPQGDAPPMYTCAKMYVTSYTMCNCSPPPPPPPPRRPHLICVSWSRRGRRFITQVS